MTEYQKDLEIAKKVMADGESDTVERFFAESPLGWEEISKQQYFERVGENNG